MSESTPEANLERLSRALSVMQLMMDCANSQSLGSMDAMPESDRDAMLGVLYKSWSERLMLADMFGMGVITLKFDAEAKDWIVALKGTV
jgi:hypothetical protein